MIEDFEAEELTDDDSEDGEGLFEHHRFVVDKGQQPLRIDKYLLHKFANIARNKIQNSIDNGFIQVNQQATKANYKVRPLDVITFSLPTLPRDTEVVPENIPLDIRYEDDTVLVVYKPAGMVVHPAQSNWTGTLVNALAYHFQNLPENRDGRPGLVHRIDKDTSGLLVIAKTEEALTHLGRQFFNHTTKRTYYALVWGTPKEAAGTIDINLARSPKDRRIVETFKDPEIGKRAITHYRVLKDLHYVSLIQCQLETGRTHQIRAHMKYLGHPLFNDGAYGGDKVLRGTVFSKYKSFVENCFAMMQGQALHAKSLGFEHPKTGEWMDFESDLPEDFQKVLARWENYIEHSKL
jgi:23S rRNA pseudouridine1911/1915/1917 synthase